MTFRHYRKRNRRSFFPQMMNPIINGTYLKQRDMISIFSSTTSCSILSGFIFVSLMQKIYNRKEMEPKGSFKAVNLQLFGSYSNTMLNYIFGNHCYTQAHTARPLPVLMVSTSLEFSISPTFAVTKYTTPIFILNQFASFLSVMIAATGKMIVHLGYQLEIVVALESKQLIFFCEKKSQQKTESNKKSLDFEKE